MSNDVEMDYEEMAQDNAELERENEFLSRENAALVARLNDVLDGSNDNSVLELSKFRKELEVEHIINHDLMQVNNALQRRIDEACRERDIAREALRLLQKHEDEHLCNADGECNEYDYCPECPMWDVENAFLAYALAEDAWPEDSDE